MAPACAPPSAQGRRRRRQGVARNGKSLSSGQLAKIYGFTDLDGSQPDASRYVPEVQDAGNPADITGYRLTPAADPEIAGRSRTWCYTSP
jgi:hypothetical protein